MSYTIDFHTHSVASPDGSLTQQHYQKMLDSKKLDYIAVTDHNTIDMAVKLHAQLGERIIIGEEITTKEGEIIGLYLKQEVPPFLSAKETVERIRKQGGIVYIPHPFETVRKGLTIQALKAISDTVDVMEVHNGRAVFQNRSSEAKAWCTQHNVVAAASSDAHGWHGWGNTYTIVDAKPTRDNLVTLLRGAQYKTGFPGLRGLAYPKINRLRRRGGADV